jgi:hypothetical protein
VWLLLLQHIADFLPDVVIRVVQRVLIFLEELIGVRVGPPVVHQLLVLVVLGVVDGRLESTRLQRASQVAQTDWEEPVLQPWSRGRGINKESFEVVGFHLSHQDAASRT